jgi:hypothetical protein
MSPVTAFLLAPTPLAAVLLVVLMIVACVPGLVVLACLRCPRG